MNAIDVNLGTNRLIPDI